MSSKTRVYFIYCSPVAEDSSRFATLPVKRMARVCDETSISFHAVYSGELDAEILEDVGVTTHQVSPPRSDNPLLKAPWLYRTARKVVQSHDIDVLTNVWSHYEMAPVAAGSGPAKVAVRIVGEPISNPASSTGFSSVKGRIGRQLEQLSVRLSDAVYFNSHTLKERFESRLSLPPTAPVISQGVDTGKFSPSETTSAEEPIFLFVGRLDSNRKGIERTVDVFERFRERNGEGKLVLAGRGELPTDVRQKVERLEEIESVGHLPHSELATLYQDATALLLLSESEALPNVVLEAMASGLPVIATPVGDIPRLLNQNRGRLVDESGIDNVVSEMETVVENLSLRAEMASNARSYVEAEHSFDAVSVAFQKLFYGRLE